MISNERQWPHQRQSQQRPAQSYSRYDQQRPGYDQPYYDRPNKPQSPPADTLETRELQVERKHYVISLRENARGRFLQISEQTNGRSNMIVIPAPGLPAIQKMLEEIVKAAHELPPQQSQPIPLQQSEQPPA